MSGMDSAPPLSIVPICDDAVTSITPDRAKFEQGGTAVLIGGTLAGGRGVTGAAARGIRGAAAKAPAAAATGLRSLLGRLRGDTAAKGTTRTVTMGRNMGERVIPYAEKRGYDWYRGTPGWVPRKTLERISPATLQRTDLWFNKRWIRREMRRGSDIVDIGEPAGYARSPFYEMERSQVSGYPRYRQDPQP